MKPIFQRSPTLTLRLILFSALSVVLMTMETRNEEMGRFRSFFNELLYPIHLMVDLPTSMIKETREVISSRATLIEENRKLKEEQLILQSQLQKFNLLEAENERLQQLLSSSKRVKQRVLIAEMLAVDMDPYRHNIIIDKGRNHAVYVGQPIIDANGVMGQITQVSSNSSIALLITDPSHSIPVRVVRNGLRSIAAGTGNPHAMRLEYIPSNGDIEVGDTLVSSGLGGRFPVDFPVATVTEIERPRGKPFATVYAHPVAEIDRSHEILLVWQENGQPPTLKSEELSSSIEPWPSVDSLALYRTSLPLINRQWQ